MSKKELKEIEELESKYFQKITYFLKFISKDFIKELNRTQKYKEQYKDKTHQIDNYSIGIERLFYSYFSSIFFGKSLALPVSSDLCFEMEDAVVHIDVKTINKERNLTDGVNNIFIKRNQTSYSDEQRNIKAGLPTFYVENENTKKACLTYFVIVYYDNSPEVQEIIFCCLPNGELYRHYTNKIYVAGKSKGDGRFQFKEISQFELLDTKPKRWISIYNNEIETDILFTNN